MMPALAVLGFAAGVATVILMRHSTLRSTWGVSVCFFVMLTISQYYQIERDLVTGLVVLASMVLLRSVFTRRRRLFLAAHPVYQDTEDEDGLEDEDRELGPATSGPR
jgi:hypothetical protein